MTPVSSPEPSPAAAALRAELRLPSTDPFSGDPLVVTRLLNPATGTSFEGQFSLGWIGRLSTEQVDFVGLLLARRNNLHKLAADLGIAYNTARGRFEEVVRALGGDVEDDDAPGSAASKPLRQSPLRDVLQKLARGEITPDEADVALRGD